MYLKKHRFRHFFIVIISCLCAVILTVGGCAPLRKKFIRKKKKDQVQGQKFIPVLEPIDYPKKEYSVEERYKHHYSLWKIWDRDLLQSIDRDDSVKRQKYLLEKTVEQLEEMKKFLADGKRRELSELVEHLRVVQRDYERPDSMRNKFSIKKRIQLNAKRIRNGFAPDLLLPYRK